ncbi:MAG: glycosyltransferase family 4 protein [Stenomitos frigidus ULC029]
MKLAYVTPYDPHDINMWSGLSYYIAQSLQNDSISLDYVGPLRDRLSSKIVRKCKRHYHALSNKTYLRDPEPFILKDYASQITKKVSRLSSDVIFSPTSSPIAYLESDRPIAFWADATFAGVLDFYPHYTNLCEETIKHGHRMETLALERCQLAIYASDWAAETAINYYGADPAKVKVVPMGANLESHKTLEEIKASIQARSSTVCKLLLLGVDWYRKGGDVAFKVAKALNELGLQTELTVVGCQPILDEPLPTFVKPLGFISKATLAGKEQISQLIAESHFLIVPSQAECYGLVFCEANALGVPCLATNVGGIPTIVKDDINGKLFSLTADISEYCDYITNLFADYAAYQQLALSAFHEYQSRLNWTVAGQTVRQLLMNL